MEENDRKYEGIILGNGPSLRGFNFDILSKIDVFGMNSAYRYWYEINWFPQYYSCLDLVVGLSHCEQIAKLIENAKSLGIKSFLLRQNLIDKLKKHVDTSLVVNFDQLLQKYKLLQTKFITTGSHTCAWASILGKKYIYLLGIDCNYIEILSNAEVEDGSVLRINKQKENPNYFFDHYQLPGDLYHRPNPIGNEHVDSWKELSISFSGKSIKVFNVNQMSRLDCFPFGSLEKMISGLYSNRKYNSSCLRLGLNTSVFKLNWLSMDNGNDSIFRETGPGNCSSLSFFVDRGREMLLILEVSCQKPITNETFIFKEAGENLKYIVFSDTENTFIGICLSSNKKIDRPTDISIHLSSQVRSQVPEDNVLGLKVFSASVVSARTPLGGEFPLSHFDGWSYLRNNLDVAEGVRRGTFLSAISHYVEFGRSQKRSFPLALSTRPTSGYRFELEEWGLP